jgi:hypothetical protein
MAGARTSAQARAATTAPPLMPGLVWPAFTPLTSAALGEQAITPADSSLPAALTQASSPREPSARREDAEVSPHAETGADESLRLSSTVPEMKAEPVRQEWLSGLGERVGFEPGPVIRAPEGLRPHSTPSPATLNIEMPPPLPIAHTTPVLGSDTDGPARRVSAPAQPIERLSGNNRSLTVAAQHPTQAHHPIQNRDREGAVAGRWPGYSVTSPQPESALQATVRPVPEQLAGPPTVPAASGGHQSRITIGRIDVQVNNHPPVQASAPPSRLAAPLPSDVLEARFLNRFWMKP